MTENKGRKKLENNIEEIMHKNGLTIKQLSVLTDPYVANLVHFSISMGLPDPYVNNLEKREGDKDAAKYYQALLKLQDAGLLNTVFKSSTELMTAYVMISKSKDPEKMKDLINDMAACRKKY